MGLMVNCPNPKLAQSIVPPVLLLCSTRLCSHLCSPGARGQSSALVWEWDVLTTGLFIVSLLCIHLFAILTLFGIRNTGSTSLFFLYTKNGVIYARHLECGPRALVELCACINPFSWRKSVIEFVDDITALLNWVTIELSRQICCHFSSRICSSHYGWSMVIPKCWYDWIVSFSCRTHLMVFGALIGTHVFETLLVCVLVCWISFYFH